MIFVNQLAAPIFGKVEINHREKTNEILKVSFYDFLWQSQFYHNMAIFMFY